ncbi:hypothetical protein ACFYXM_11080 [Streptomyces sp. NPDC002476]
MAAKNRSGPSSAGSHVAKANGALPDTGGVNAPLAHGWCVRADGSVADPP